MAELQTQDVVNLAQPVGDSAPSGATAETTSDIKPGEGDERKLENGIHMDDDVAARSDTDTSRAEESVADDNKEKPVKKLAVVKPISFAKYSVPKVIAANAATKGVDKAPTPAATTPALLQAGRPRLVAKTSAALQTKPRPFKAVAPDPLQVWNKNRVTPQPSTKHLTDEELQKQYGIHMTSRLQSDGDGKEAKWADIDDDEDDWAPETIEWNDGTKSTLNAADVTPTSQEPKNDIDSEIVNNNSVKLTQRKALTPLTPQHSIGPNALVLKLGTNAEKQQAEKQMAQKVASLQKGSTERTPHMSSKTAPAPPPVKSPWAPLPPVEKVSPILINPQIPQPQRFPPGYGYAPNPASMTASSPAKEISADDFNRTWRDNQTNQPRELFMPNSGTYQPVPESKRRMSRNEPGFRAPAVLQRPGQMDAATPAEPSAAFQTTRNSSDEARRRASSTISGGSGQLARRLSMKSSEVAALSDAGTAPRDASAIRPDSRDGVASAAQTPSTYQARGADYLSGAPVSTTDPDYEVQREAQRAMMKEKRELARKRKIEEEERLEREKRERIAQKLASLGPDPRTLKESTEPTTEVVEPSSVNAESPQETAQATAPLTISPPKPPQPLATGEPQQYGMMKVHPLNTVHKPSPPAAQVSEPSKMNAEIKLPPPQQDAVSAEVLATASPTANGIDPDLELPQTHLAENVPISEHSPLLAKAPATTPDMRAGWGDLRNDHRTGASSLWSLPHHNKALGNGTFDQNLAGYAPHDLSRASHPAQTWMSGRTPLSGRSPQPQHVHHTVPESRSPLLPSLVSPDQQPLTIGSEVDSMFPSTKPAPIGPPQPQVNHVVNGVPQPGQVNSTAAWNNFYSNASQQERAESERIQREFAARREEEQRTGRVHGPQYTFNETWKQVSVGDSAGQRQVSGLSHSAVGPGHQFGAIGSIPGGNNARGSRFFPPLTNGYPIQDRRAFTYSHPEPPRSPSPPPAEDFESAHPAYEGDSRYPVIHFPPTKPVVKLPPVLPPTPPSPEPSELAQASTAPLSWAARVSMPPPPPPAQLRAVSTPIAQTASWQERFNGLLGKGSPGKQIAEVVANEKILLAPAQITSSSREVLDDLPLSTAVSLPAIGDVRVDISDLMELLATKEVEEEDDLFEDREPGSLPIINLPRDIAIRLTPRRKLEDAQHVEPTSAEAIFFYNPFQRHLHKPFGAPNAIFVMLPGMKGSKKITVGPGESPNGFVKQRNSSYNTKYPRGGAKAGPLRSRQVTPKAQQA